MINNIELAISALKAETISFNYVKKQVSDFNIFVRTPAFYFIRIRDLVLNICYFQNNCYATVS